MTALITLPAALGLIVLAQPVISVLFERGAFTYGDLVRTAGAMQFYAVGLLGLAASILLTRCFFAMRDSRTPVIVASSVMVLNVVLSALLVHPFGVNGLASANSLASLAEAAILYWLLRSRIGASDDELAGPSVFRILVASACMALAGVLRQRHPVARRGHHLAAHRDACGGHRDVGRSLPRRRNAAARERACATARVHRGLRRPPRGVGSEAIAGFAVADPPRHAQRESHRQAHALEAEDRDHLGLRTRRARRRIDRCRGVRLS